MRRNEVLAREGIDTNPPQGKTPYFQQYVEMRY